MTPASVLLASGTVGAWAFVIVFVIDGLTRPGYSHRRHPVSALSLGPRGWVQTTSFVVNGALIALSGPALGAASSSRWLGATILVLGLALVASGVWRMDPMDGFPPGAPDDRPAATSRAHAAHDNAGAVVFLALPVAAVLAALAADVVAWQVASATVAMVAGGLFVWFGALWERADPHSGLVQKAAIVVGWGWLGALCLDLAVSAGR